MTLSPTERARLIAWCDEVAGQLDDAKTDSDARWRTENWPSDTDVTARALRSILQSQHGPDASNVSAVTATPSTPVEGQVQTGGLPMREAIIGQIDQLLSVDTHGHIQGVSRLTDFILSLLRARAQPTRNEPLPPPDPTDPWGPGYIARSTGADK